MSKERQAMIDAKLNKMDVEIVVSTYWPTKIIKSVTIKDTTKDYSNSITLPAREAKYLYTQMALLYKEQADV